MTTTRRGEIATVAAVDLTWETVHRADPMLVAHWHPRATARAGIQYASATGRHHAFQSKFEQKLVTSLDFDGLIELTSQPFELEWHDGSQWRRHTPDFAALTEQGPLLINVRPAERLNARHHANSAALAAVASQAGWGSAVVVGYASPALPIIGACATARLAADPLGIADQIRATLADGPRPFHSITAATECDPFARSMLRTLIWHRQVSVDLNQNLDDRTIVTLAGGA